MKSSEVGYDREQAINACKNDLNFFAGLCVPDVFRFFFPPIFLAIWNLIVTSVHEPKGLLQLAIGLPRGFAKTFFLKIYCVYCILFTEKSFILIVCNTEQLAMNFIADVCDILNSGNIKMLFGDWNLGLEKGTQSLKKFAFRGRDIIIAGVGVGTSLRGLNLKFRRPDLMIMDDMQSREDAENPTIADKQLVWMMGTLLKARNYEHCLAVFVGNLYPFNGSILKKLKYNPKWISFICGGILADGKSLWEELRPVEDLLSELENDIAMGHPEIFYSEVLNDEEAGTISGVDVSKIPPYPTHLDAIEPQGGFIIIDPASLKKSSNDTAIGEFLIFDEVPVLRRVQASVMTPLETIHNALKMALTAGIKVIAVESNAYQFTLIFWFEHVCQQLDIAGIEFCELNAGNMSKNAKIKEMLPQLLKGEIVLHPDVRSKVVNQIVHWNPLRISNVDDLLDLLAWCFKTIELYGSHMELLDNAGIPSMDMVPLAATDEEIAAQLAF